MDRMSVGSHDELLAALPHVFGFKATESVIVVPLRGRLPTARVDIPKTAADRRYVVGNLREAYARNGPGPVAALGIVCLTEDRRAAESTTRDLAEALEGIGALTPLRLWATAEQWTDLISGETGPRTALSQARLDRAAARLGRPAPEPSRESLSAAMRGDREPVAAVLDQARTRARQNTEATESSWALDRLARFHADGHSLSDGDAARMLVALESKPTRDAVWDDMSPQNCESHLALWTDLTRRAPDEVRTPAASLLAFSHWLHGDGARGWCALGQIPPETEHYTMASLVFDLLEKGMHPRVWREAKAALSQSEAFVPTQPAHHDRIAPVLPIRPDRGAPGI